MAYKNKEDQIAAMKRWRENNKDKVKAYNREVRAPRKRKARLDLKTEAINKLGGKCSKCGYSKCIAALDFHHVGQKEHLVSLLIKDNARTKVFEEIKNCVLLCSNCHREEHYTLG